jgi:uncharacterized protein (TIGR02271 family)
MNEQLSADELARAENAPVYDSSGEQIGHVGEIWADEQSGQAEWLKIGTGFLGMKNLFVPVQGGRLEEDGFHAAYSKDQVEGSPELEGEWDDEYESRLYESYGLERGMQPAASDTMTRSEEELAVGKQSVEAGTVRLRKYVETEPVEMDVELQRETARVTRETIDQPVEGVELSEEEIEVPLTAERPVVSKQTVAKERVALETDVETETQTVRDELRKERVEVEGEQDS